MENNHKHKFINTGQYSEEIALVDFYNWKCVDCEHIEKADDNGRVFQVNF
jgi:hypothetical protein